MYVRYRKACKRNISILSREQEATLFCWLVDSPHRINTPALQAKIELTAIIEGNWDADDQYNQESSHLSREKTTWSG